MSDQGQKHQNRRKWRNVFLEINAKYKFETARYECF